MKKTIIFFVAFFLILPFKNTIQAIELENIDIHGFISQGYLKTDKNNYLAETQEGTFEFNEMGINFSTDLTDRLHLGMQFFARDLGMIGNDDIILDWAFADYRLRNWLGFRIGKIKFDYGLYNETRDMDMLRTSVMLPQSVYPELWRNSFSKIKGIALYGYLPLSFMGRLAYNAQIGTMEFNQDSGFVGSFGPRLHNFLNINLDIASIDTDYTWVCSLGWNTPLPSLKTKITYYDIEGMKTHSDMAFIDPNGNLIHSQVDFQFNKRDGYVLSLEYMWKNLVLVAEYAQDNLGKMSPPPPPPPPFWTSPPTEDEPSPQDEPPQETEPWPQWPQLIKSEGWYMSASYRFTSWFELGLSYSEYYPDADHKHGNKIFGPDFMSWLKTITLSTRFDINDYWILKLETSYNDGFGGINLANNPHGLNQYWYLFAAKSTFSF